MHRSTLPLLFVATAAAAPLPAAAAQQVATWTVGSDPTLVIGTLEGTPEETLVNILAATELADGTIVLQNSTRGLFEVRWYDAGGQLISTGSRFGEGPFEFEYANLLRHAGDSVLVVEESGRYAIFGPRAEEVREGRLVLGTLARLGVTQGAGGGRLVTLRSPPSRGLPEPGTRRGVGSHVISIGVERPAVDTVGVHMGPRSHIEGLDNGVWFYATPFFVDGHVAVGGDLVWIGDSAERTVFGYRAPIGGPVVAIEAPFERTPVSGGDRRRAREAYSALGSGDDEARWARYARSMEYPDEMPWYGDLRTDRLGNVWIQEYEPFWAEGPSRWVVFSPDGRHIADASIPGNVLPACARRPAWRCSGRGDYLEIGDDYLLLQVRDEWGAAYVHRYELTKGSDTRR